MAMHYSNHNVAVREGRVQIRILGNLDDERVPKSTRKELRNLEGKSKMACDERRDRRLSTARMRRRDRREDSDDSVCGNGGDVEDDDDDDVDDILTICLAINYGGRADIVRAATELAQSIIAAAPDSSSSSSSSSNTADDSATDAAAAANKKMPQQQQCNEIEISKRLSTSSIPDVDLIVRTGGERRLSNFFLWEGAYAELYFTDVLWPDFDDEELKKALEWYGHRNRRFGGR